MTENARRKAHATSGLTRWNGSEHDPVSWLKKERQNYLADPLPCSDHVSFWVADDGARLVISQPYGPLTSDHLADVAEAAKRLSLNFSIDGSSWHYPGWTVLLKWSARHD